MKRLIVLILTMALALMPLGACAQGAAGVRVVYATTAPAFALAEGMLRGIAEFEVRQLMQPQLDCARLYQLSEWDQVQLSGAELCVVWGGGLESFADTLSGAEDGPAVITLADAGEDWGALAEELADYDYYGHFTGADPHSYMSLARMSAALDALYEALGLLYPEMSERLAANHERMREQLAAARERLRSLADDGAGQRLALLMEGAPYAAQELGLDWAYVYPREPASAVEDADWGELLERLEGSGATAVVLERQAPAELVRGLSASGWEVRRLGSLAMLDEPLLEEYLDVMMDNAQALVGGE